MANLIKKIQVGEVIYDLPGDGHIYDPVKDSLAEGVLESVAPLNTASGQRSHAEGNHTTASGNYSHAEGKETTANGADSHAEGSGTQATTHAHAEGLNAKATGQYAHAEGSGTTASKVGSHAEGLSSTASGNYAHAEGGATASGQYAHAEGQSSAAAKWAHTEGKGVISSTSATSAHAEGTSTAGQAQAHAEGQETTAAGVNAHSEGYKTQANASHSHAEGKETTAGGQASHAEGYSTTASGADAHAEGSETTAAHTASHAGGIGTETGRDYQTVIGQYNNVDSDALFVIGNGSEEEHSNVFKVDTTHAHVDGIKTLTEDWQAINKYFATDGSIQEIKNGDLLTPITYKELVELSDNAELIPGMRYRIIDYESYFYGDDITSAGHPFDVIVLATSNTELNENALAIESERDSITMSHSGFELKVEYPSDGHDN